MPTSTTGGLTLGFDTKGEAVPKGNVPLDQASTQQLLANMQQMIDQRQSPLNQIIEGIKDTSAWGAGGTEGPTRALALRAAEKNKEEQEDLARRQSIAAMRAQLANQQQVMNYNLGLSPGTSTQAATTGNAPTLGGTATQPAGGRKSPVQEKIDKLPDSLKWVAYSYLNKPVPDFDAIDEMVKEYEIKGKPELAKNAAFIDSLPEGPQKEILKHQAFEKGYGIFKTVKDGFEVPYSPGAGGTPSGQAAPSTTGDKNHWELTKGQGTAVQVASSLGVPIISGDRDWDKQYNLYLNSKKPGYSGPPVAFPGYSQHETGNAIDVGPLTADQRQKLLDAGFTQPVPNPGAKTTEPSYTGGLPTGSTAATETFTKNVQANNEDFNKNTGGKLGEQILNDKDRVRYLDDALKIVSDPKSDIGPGSSFRQAITQAKGYFVDLSDEQLKDLTTKNVVDQALKKQVVGNVKTALGGQLSDRDVAIFEKTIGSINDPKEFLKRTLEFEKASIVARNNLNTFISQANVLDKKSAFADYMKPGGQYEQDLTKNLGVSGSPATAAPSGKPLPKGAPEGARWGVGQHANKVYVIQDGKTYEWTPD